LSLSQSSGLRLVVRLSADAFLAAGNAALPAPAAASRPAGNPGAGLVASAALSVGVPHHATPQPWKEGAMSAKLSRCAVWLAVVILVVLWPTAAQ
jgi:hypothetical protein